MASSSPPLSPLSPTPISNFSAMSPTTSPASALPSSAPYSLHVCNIPADMGKAGLKNLFAKYGEVTEIYLSE